MRTFPIFVVCVLLGHVGCSAELQEAEENLGTDEQELSGRSGERCDLAATVLPNPDLYPPSRFPPYAEQDAFARRITGAMLPTVLRVMNISPSRVYASTTPGGFQGIVFPSLQVRATLRSEDCTRLAAAIGYTFEQNSVLTWKPGTDAYIGRVAFVDGNTSPERASLFFSHVLQASPALGGGFSTRPPTQLFINVRSPLDGQPFSGLSNTDYGAQLRRAASTFPVRTFVVDSKVKDELVASPWTAYPAGEGYVAVIGAATARALDPQRLTYENEARDATR